MSGVRTTTDPVDSQRRIVRTGSADARRSEVRCPHSFTEHDLIRVQSYRWTIFTCRACLNDLVYAMNRILGDVMKKAMPELTVDGNVGVWCQACGQRKTGIFYQTNVINLQREVTETDHHEYVTQKVKRVEIVCEDCHTDISHPRVLLRTRRNVFIPAEVDDKVIKGLWGDSLDRTKKIFTLIPTLALKEILQSLPEDRRETVRLALTGPAVDGSLEGGV